MCVSSEFPGKSVDIGLLNDADRSVYTDSKFSSQPDEKFYSSFLEERFEKAKFEDEENYPDIANADEIYRFFWLRTFHNPYVFRAYRIGDDKFIVSKMTDGKGGYGIGTVADQKTRQLTDAEWCEFIALLDKANFWSKEKVDVKKLANDGAMWEMEGYRERRYYITGEQSPAGGEFREACLYLMQLSGFKIEEIVWEFY
ncbi:MAG: hypothetical protein ABL959_06570 [Pyrinomonadaceae bacterium]